MARRRWNTETIQKALNGENIAIQVGYSDAKFRKKKIRKDGDKWVDNKGVKWTQVNGYAKKVESDVTKIIREAQQQICKRCGMDVKWGNRYDTKFYRMTGECYDCVIERETQMRIDGTYEKYEKIKMANNQLSYLQELKQKMTEATSYLKDPENHKLKYVNSNGTVDTWTDETNYHALSKEIQADLKLINKQILKVGKELKKLEQ